MIHRFRRFGIDEDKRDLRVDGGIVEVQPRVFDLLVYLEMYRERVVPKDELPDAFWPGVTVADGTLQRAISVTRSALDRAGAAKSIRTYSRQGYRLCAEDAAVDGVVKAGSDVKTGVAHYKWRGKFGCSSWSVAHDANRGAVMPGLLTTLVTARSGGDPAWHDGGRVVCVAEWSPCRGFTSPRAWPPLAACGRQ